MSDLRIKLTPFLLCCLMAICLMPMLDAAEPDPLFASSELLAISITAPFAVIDKERDKEKEYDGTVSYLSNTGEEISLEVALKVRGNWRLNRRNCSYSQLWVDFKRRQTQGTLFANQNRLKLVVQCKNQDRYAEYIVKEQQAYQLFGLLSELNFATRLVSATYVDSEDHNRTRTQLAFFIEHQNRLAKRFELATVDLDWVSLNTLNPRQADLVSLFMYMIGNTDYSIAQGEAGEGCCHNAKLLKASDGEYIAIPYDFDGSGFVDASYAAQPSPSLRLRSNRSRRFRGYCRHSDTLGEAIEAVLSYRAQFNDLVGDTTLLRNRTINTSRKYIEEFFDIINDPQLIERRINRDCRE